MCIRDRVRTPGFHPGNRVSIPLRDTKDLANLFFARSLFSLFIAIFCPVRLVVRTPGFHPGNRGSIPLRDTKAVKTVVFAAFFVLA